jgi:serpin B
MNIKRKSIIAIIVAIAFGQVTLADTDVVVAGNTAFTFDIYPQLQAEGNLFFSPYSISSALAMTYAGARGNTAAQMSQVLHFAPDQTQFHPAFGDLQASVNATQAKGDIALNVANRLWVQNSYPFRESFLDVVQRYYQAEPKSVDFITDHEDARQQINAWVEEQTNDKIQELIQPGILNELTRLVLVNAIYFNGDWAAPFDVSATINAPFWVTPDESVEVPMMSQSGLFKYMENDTLQVLELPYKGNEVSMIVLLPRDGLAALESSLEQLNDWLSDLQEQKIDVHMPRFKMITGFELSDTLERMGMPDAFDPDTADLSGMAELPPGVKLVIDKVIHKAFVEVNEVGTEAAGTTAVVVMEVTSINVGQPIFRADHPFLFLIRHNPTGSILFFGRVENPPYAPPPTTEASLSPELKLHLPMVHYLPPNDDEIYIFWADLELVLSDQILFELVDFQLVKEVRLGAGEEHVPPASEAIFDMSALCIPIVHYRSASGHTEKLWAKLKLDDSESMIRFYVVDYGVWDWFEPKCQ